MQKHKLPLLKKVTILDAGAEGKTIARVNDRVIFVDNAVPDDVVDIQIIKKKKSYWEGRAVCFHHYSDKRTTPFCSHFGVCGGCKWQMLQYKEQLFYKQKQVKDNFERIAKINLSELSAVIPSEKTEYYRNKLEFTFSHQRWLTNEEIGQEAIIPHKQGLGFHVKERFDKVIDIEHCYLQKEPSNAIRLAVKEYAIKHQLTFFDLYKQQGLLRNLTIRTTSTGDVMVLFAFSHEDKPAIKSLLTHILTLFPQITSLLYVINGKRNDTIFDLEVQTFYGNDYIVEKMEELFFRIGAKSFYQTHSEQAYRMYKIIREFAQFHKSDTVFDLYTGTGTIANFIAKEVKQVIAVEFLKEAVKDAEINAQINGITNILFYDGDIKDVINEEFILHHTKPDVIITDPPRAGMHPDVVAKILDIQPDRIVYVSCNPATQARDIALLATRYEVKKIQPIDMFPHTHHVENIVLLQKNK